MFLILRSIILKFSGIFLSYILNILIIRWTDNSVAGGFFAFVATLSVIGAVMFGGLSKYLVRELASQSISPPQSLRLIKKVLILISISFGIIYYLLRLEVFNLSFNPIVLFLTLPLITVISLISSYLRGIGSHIWGNLEGPILRPIIAIILLGSFASYFSLNEAILRWIYFASCIFGLIFLLIRLNNTPYAHVNSTAEKFLIKKSSILYLTLFSTCEAALLNLDIILVDFILGPEVSTELKIIYLFKNILMLPLITSNMLLPQLLAAKVDVMIFKKFIKYSIISISLVLSIVILIFGEQISYDIFGVYVSGLSFLIFPYVIMSLIIAITGPTLETVIAHKKEKTIILFSVFAVISSVPLYIIFLPTYGLILMCFVNAGIVSAQYIFSSIRLNHVS
jgi:O-antigen/teichoic acid export membrane protein